MFQVQLLSLWHGNVLMGRSLRFLENLWGLSRKVISCPTRLISMTGKLLNLMPLYPKVLAHQIHKITLRSNLSYIKITPLKEFKKKGGTWQRLIRSWRYIGESPCVWAMRLQWQHRRTLHMQVLCRFFFSHCIASIRKIHKWNRVMPSITLWP